jgi:two-component system, OmpR family, osmolarity sensor histidine kinase EnvZ
MRLSLFSRALLTLVVTFGLFAFLAFAAVVQFALIPVADRSTQDLSALMLLATDTLAHLDPGHQGAFRANIERDHGLSLLAPGQGPLDLSDYYFPYMERLKMALGERVGTGLAAGSNLQGGERWFWIRLPAMGEPVWVGFPRKRVQSRPFEGLAVVIAISIFLLVLSAAVLARRVTVPLERMSKAAEQVAQGFSPTPLPETGPRELANLARQFNATSRQVRELLANRTLLLAGISHDLRTPLTRLRLALEMLPRNPEHLDLLERMERDLDEMNGLISQATELGRSLGRGEPKWVDLGKLLDDLCKANPRLKWEGATDCRYRVDPLALRRIIGNLLENALRYSQDEVEVRLECNLTPAIRIMDRGPGIPEQEREAVFRPFYRLEQSRNRATGGSGLGLAVSRELAMANGIELGLEPRPGGGVIASLRWSQPVASGNPMSILTSNPVDATGGTA